MLQSNKYKKDSRWRSLRVRLAVPVHDTVSSEHRREPSQRPVVVREAFRDQIWAAEKRRLYIRED